MKLSFSFHGHVPHPGGVGGVVGAAGGGVGGGPGGGGAGGNANPPSNDEIILLQHTMEREENRNEGLWLCLTIT